MTPASEAWHVQFRVERKRLLTQDQLVETIGATRRSISRWENGDTYPDTAHRPALARLSPTMRRLMDEIPDRQTSDSRRLEELAEKVLAIEAERAELGPELADAVQVLGERLDRIESRLDRLEAAPARSARDRRQ